MAETAIFYIKPIFFQAYNSLNHVVGFLKADHSSKSTLPFAGLQHMQG
jgi:hypothetical protein